LATGSSWAQNRVINPIDLSRTSALAAPVHPLAQAQYDQGPVDPAFQIQYAFLVLKASPDQQAALDQLLSQQQDRSSPNYHHWLTPEQFAGHFGVTGPDIARITAWLASQGLQVHDIARGRRWISFSGSAADTGRAFHTDFHRFRVNAEDHFANVSPLSVPAALADVIAGVQGFNDFRPKPALVKRSLKPAMTTAGEHTLAPDDFATIYNIQPLYKSGIDGTGQTIVVLGGSSVDLTDIQAFRRQFNLPAKVPQSLLFGPDPGMLPGWLTEADLDLEWAGAVAPKATILYVYAQNILYAGVQAVDQNLAPIITLSYSQCEQETTPDLRSVVQQANAQGITWLVSSGDAGAAGCEYFGTSSQAAKGKAASFPASIPEVTGVGGTQFEEGSGNYWSPTDNANHGSALSYIPEKVWNDTPTQGYILASGGGASTFFEKPVWQSGPGVPNDNARDVPDISLAASPYHDGYQIFSEGELFAVGGTSVSTPAFAGIVGLLNHYLTSHGKISQPGLGNINTVLYRMAQSTPEAFHDISGGNNRVPCVQGTPDCSDGSLGYSAGAGYDLATGLGSVDVFNLATKWNQGSTSATSVTANPASIGFNGGAIQFTAVVTASGATPTGSVTFLSGGMALGTAALASSGDGNASATLSIDSALLPIGADTVAANYPGDSHLDGSGGSTTATVLAPSSGSAVTVSVSPNPVPRQVPDPNGYEWFYTIIVKEEAGVATTLTGFSIDGVSENSRLQVFFSNTAIPANGVVYGYVDSRGLNAPLTRTFAVSGQDADGRTWSAHTTALFLTRQLLEPQIKLTSTPGTVRQDPSADPSCQWKQQLIVQELSGFWVDLFSLTRGDNDLSDKIQNIFGTTSLAPYGSLHGELCVEGSSAASTWSYEIDGFTETNDFVAATLSTVFITSATGPATLSATPAAITLPVPDSSGSASASLTLNATGGTPSWSISVVPANLTTSWLTVSQATGNAPAQVNIQASAAGLSKGAYTAWLVIQSVDGSPQYIDVPVTLIVGASSTTVINGVSNTASGKVVFAPGMVMSAYGAGLAPPNTALQAPMVPLPFNMAGTSATVNGVSAPLYYVSPTQVNVQIPYETPAGPAVLGVNNNGQVAAFPFQVAISGPGIFTTPDLMLVPAAGGKPGDILLIFMTGEGDVDPPLLTGTAPIIGTPLFLLPQPMQPVKVTVAGIAAETQFVGIPYSLVGVTQINFTIPATAPLGKQPVVVTVGGIAAQTAYVNVTQ
jgi:uncharacterized protein (TIGR03437 family)